MVATRGWISGSVIRRGNEIAKIYERSERQQEGGFVQRRSRASRRRGERISEEETRDIVHVVDCSERPRLQANDCGDLLTSGSKARLTVAWYAPSRGFAGLEDPPAVPAVEWARASLWIASGGGFSGVGCFVPGRGAVLTGIRAVVELVLAVVVVGRGWTVSDHWADLVSAGNAVCRH